MFGNNAFGALGVDQNQAGPSRKQIQGEEIDVDWLQLVKTNHDVNVRVSERINVEGLPLECNLMAVSNKLGVLIVGSNSDVRIHRLNDFHKLLEESPKDGSPVSEPILTIPLPGRPIWIRLAAEETKLVVTTASPASAQVFRLSDLLAGNTTPTVSVTNDFPEHVLDLLPNPAPPSTSDTLARHTAIVTSQGLALLDIEDGKLTAPIQGQLTCASWSAKGKQIVCGERSGKLVQYTPDGTAKAEIIPPPELASEFYPTSVEWLENDLFLVSYKNANGDDDEPLSVFIIHRTKEEVTYTEFFDPLNTMGLPSRSASYRSVASLKAWGDATRHLTFLLSGKSSEVAVMRGKPAQGKEAPSWESLILEETARGVMPTGKTGVSEDSSCIGLELDLTSTKSIKMGIVGGIEVPDLPPAPRLLAYSQEGFIISFDVRYPDAGGYPNMVTPQDAPTSTATTAPAAPESAKPAFGGSAFGSTPSASPSAFGSPGTPTGGFGQPAFGKPAGNTGFGQSAFGQPAAPATSSPFGQPAAPKASSPFGQPASPAASPFGQSSAPAFGQGGFGQKTETKSAFGSTTPSSSPFGQKTETKSAFGSGSATTSAFGAPASGSAFGKPAFGGSTPAFGQTGFGSSTPPASAPSPAFGASAFGTPSTPAKSTTAFGQQGSTTPATTPGPAFGQTAFGQKPIASSSDDKPAFGQTSTPTAFGQPSKPTAFGASSTASAFGSVPSTGGFAGFGSSKPVSFGGSAFGQTKPTDSGSSPFGSGGAVKSGSAFGSSSGFGQSAFGAKSSTPTPSGPFTKPAEPVPEAKKDSPAPAPPAPASTGGFGLGGLGSALDSSKSTSKKNDGMDSLFASSKSTIQENEGTSPPDSPVLGATKQVDSDDESPPTPKPSQAPSKSSTSTTNSFIKPATAFGSSSAFGQQQQQSTTPTSTPAKQGGTPNAFSKPASTTPLSSGFGSTGFGSSAFGKPSTPSASAFGKPPAPVGNISGGFGGFAAKSPSATGFAGFGAAPKNASDSNGGSFASLLSGEKKDEAKTPAATPPTAPVTSKVEPVVVKEEPKDLDKPEAQTPVGYDVPSTSTPRSKPAETPVSAKSPKPAETTKPAETPKPADTPKPIETPKPAEITKVVEEEDVKPDISALETTSKSTTPPTPETKSPATASTTPPAEQDEEVEDRAGSSPEIVEHGDSEEHEEDDGEDYDEEEEEEEEGVNYDEEYDENGERYDDEDGEQYDEEHEESYDENEEEEEEYNEDEEPYEGEERGSDDEEQEEEQQQETGPNPEPPSGPGSLFSRLAPPAPPSFGRHAARTSSPLGTQPPQNAETSTPPGTPPSKQPLRDESASAPPPFFGFNKPPAQEVKPATPSFGFGLGKPPSQTPATSTPAPSSTSAPASAFGQSTIPVQSPVPKAAEKPLFGFGLGKPSSQPQAQPAPPQSQPPATGSPFSSFNKPSPAPSPAATAPAAPPSLFPSLFGKPLQTTPAAAAPATPSVNPPTPKAADGKFAIPARTPVKESPQAQDDGSRQMAAVMQRMITDLVSEIKTMKEALAIHAEYHRSLEPKFNKITLEDLDKHDELPFSSIEDIAKLIDQLSAEMGGRRQKDKTAELRVLELQSRMLKTDMKVKQVEKLVEAHDDATYAYHSRNQDLSPRQLNSRVQLRRRTQAVESKLEDLDRSIRKSQQPDTGRPTIDSLQSSLREVETAIAEKQDLIEDLSMRVKSIRLSTPGSRRMSTAPGPRNSIGPGAKKITTLDIPTEIADEVSRVIDREDKKIVIKAKVARLTKAPKGGIKIGELPKIDISSYIRDDEPIIKQEPDTEDIKPILDARTKSQAQSPSVPPTATIDTKPQVSPFPLNLTPAAPQPTASPSFGGFTLSLDPGDVSSSHRQRSNPGSRAHHPAPRVNLGGASPSSEAAGTASPQGLSFFPPPSGSSTSGNPGNSPKGFFSLSGFGQK